MSIAHSHAHTCTVMIAHIIIIYTTSHFNPLTFTVVDLMLFFCFERAPFSCTDRAGSVHDVSDPPGFSSANSINESSISFLREWPPPPPASFFLLPSSGPGHRGSRANGRRHRQSGDYFGCRVVAQRQPGAHAGKTVELRRRGVRNEGVGAVRRDPAAGSRSRRCQWEGRG